MPWYDYQCEDCRHYFEEQRSVEDRNHVRCSRCHSTRATIQISSVSVHFFDPYYDMSLGCSIKSPTHKKEVAKSLGLTNTGDAKLHEIEQTAETNKRYKDGLVDQDPTPEFMKAWYRVKAEVSS